MSMDWTQHNKVANSLQIDQSLMQFHQNLKAFFLDLDELILNFIRKVAPDS